jgi:hypothetical protein
VAAAQAEIIRVEGIPAEVIQVGATREEAILVVATLVEVEVPTAAQADGTRRRTKNSNN